MTGGPSITVIVPTVHGREHSLPRTLNAYAATCGIADIEVIVLEDREACGIAWQQGAEQATGDYLHFSADDLEPHQGWWEAAVETVDAGNLPCPVVLNPDGTVQSAGGDLYAPNCLRTGVADDWTEVPFAPVPFMHRDQFDDIGPVPPIHYFTDVWCSERGRHAGYETVLRHGYRFTHHNEQAGRGAGMDQGSRAHYDREQYFRHLAEATA